MASIGSILSLVTPVRVTQCPVAVRSTGDPNVSWADVQLNEKHPEEGAEMKNRPTILIRDVLATDAGMLEISCRNIFFDYQCFE